jgi:hypothetical protein
VEQDTEILLEEVEQDTESIDKLSETEKALLLLPQIYFHFVVFSQFVICLISYDQPVVFSLLSFRSRT